MPYSYLGLKSIPCRVLMRYGSRTRFIHTPVPSLVEINGSGLDLDLDLEPGLQNVYPAGQCLRHSEETAKLLPRQFVDSRHYLPCPWCQHFRNSLRNTTTTTMLGKAIVLLTCLVSITLAMESNWNQETRDQIVKIHNDYRRGEGGCHMNKLEYDMELEQQAKRWAEGCVFKHEMKEGRGENLAWDSNHNPEADMITDSAQRWFDEKKRYSYGQRSCGQTAACHYTQLVWGKTSKVGCYSTRCPNLQYAYRDAWYLVCFYTPMGNWVGEKPYDKGCSSPCLEGQTEDNGLCSGEASGDAAGGAGGACEDEDSRCGGWAGRGECKNNPSYMLNHCKKSCKQC